MGKKLFIQTLGCAMNSRDTEHMIAELKTKEGYGVTDTLEEADLILINTCSVRERPVSKLFSELGMFNKRAKEGAKIGVCGCTASHLGDQIIKRAPYVDFVLGARNTSKITNVLYNHHAVETDIDYDDSTYLFEEYRSSLYRANINISIGCDKQCTYCIVPHTRGTEVSIPERLILDEAKRAVDSGIKEIYLLGQNVNNYGRRFTDAAHGKTNFTELLRKVSEISGIERIRFTSPHPFHADDEFIDEFGRNPKICKHMHLPLQSGSTQILKAMKRGYSKEWFLEKAHKIRRAAKDVHLSTDIIVAFPGESEADFADTMEVMESVDFEQIFSFKYSPRPGTEAEKMTNLVAPEEADRRLYHLQGRFRQMYQASLQKQIGKQYKVLFEELRSGGRVFGKSDNFVNTQVEGSEALLGTIRDVEIVGIEKGSLQGKVLA